MEGREIPKGVPLARERSPASAASRSHWRTCQRPTGAGGLKETRPCLIELFMKMNLAGATRRSGEQTRELILTTALSLFREQGFDQTTMRQIAAACGVALGAAYYYFRSKEELVMAFYERAQTELSPALEQVLAARRLEERLRQLLRLKFDYFRPYRSLLWALSRHTDPLDPLSPFSDATKSVRERDIQGFERLIDTVRAPADLRQHLPRILWMYQMGILLFWIYDRSADQKRTQVLVEKTLGMVVLLIKLSSLPLMRPIRRRAVELVDMLQEG